MEIAIRNLAGHKLPTAYPSRRVWLHVSVRDPSGGRVFESGALREDEASRGTTTTPTRLVTSPITSGSNVLTRSRSTSR